VQVQAESPAAASARCRLALPGRLASVSVDDAERRRGDRVGETSSVPATRFVAILKTGRRGQAAPRLPARRNGQALANAASSGASAPQTTGMILSRPTTSGRKRVSLDTSGARRTIQRTADADSRAGRAERRRSCRDRVDRRDDGPFDRGLSIATMARRRSRTAEVEEDEATDAAELLLLHDETVEPHRRTLRVGAVGAVSRRKDRAPGGGERP